MPTNRPTIDRTLMRVAFVWEERSTCSRNNVGSVIARQGRIIGSGYNGAPAGQPHCEHEKLNFDVRPSKVLASLGNPHQQLVQARLGCTTAIHAESNAIAYCARHGVSVEDATIYTTLSPCFSCSQLIIAAGLTRVVYVRAYRDQRGIELLRSAGLIVDHLAEEKA